MGRNVPAFDYLERFMTAAPALVLKFGGTSMADPERIQAAAAIAAAEARAGRPVAVVVSAMAGETDRLLTACETLGGGLGDGETDTALAAGEQAAAALTALAIQALGLKASSMLSWQIPIHVDGAAGAARVTGIEAEGLKAMLAAGVIPVVAGFQGVDPDGRLRTLGRGGTDLTAAAIAAALDAECDIYTDVDGVFTTDPRIAPEARRLTRASHDEMLELAAMGAKVLQARSVEYAKAKGLVMRVKSSFLPAGDSAGTEIVPAARLAERRVVSGVAYQRDQARLSVYGLDPEAGGPADLFAALAEAGIGIDMIVQARSRAPADAGGAAATVEFSVEGRALPAAAAVLDGLPTLEHHAETGLAKVSVVGAGLRGRADIARTLYAALHAGGVAVRMLATSEIKISALIGDDHVERAVRALHAAYGLHEA